MYPPCISQILYLNSFGLDVVVACGGCNANSKKMLEERGVRYVDLNLSFSNRSHISTIRNIIEYRKKALKFLKEECGQDDIVWFGTADSGFLLQGKMQKKYKFVLSILELYDNNHFYRKNICKIIYDAKAVICCENTRADIMKSWWKLKVKPFVLPNKPYIHPTKKYLNGTIDTTCSMISRFSNKISILYQGIFSEDRNIDNLAISLHELDMDIGLYLLGNNGNRAAEKIQDIYQNTVYLGFAPAPFHLEVTSHAMIGVAIYADSCLNNLFCAPNKIYEYCGFGIPVLACDVPGLRNTIGKYQAGVCVNFDDTESIKQGVIEIITNYKVYSANAKKFYDSVNNEKTMREIVDRLGCSFLQGAKK